VLDDELLRDELFNRLRAAYDKCPRCTPDKTAAEKIGEALRSAGRQVVNGTKYGLKTAFWLALLASAAYGTYYAIVCINEYYKNNDAVHNFVVKNAKGRIAYLARDGKTICIAPMNNPDKSIVLSPQIPNLSIYKLLWSNDGKALYCIRDEGTWHDSKHVLVRYDIASNTSETVLDLREKRHGFQKDEVAEMRMIPGVADVISMQVGNEYFTYEPAAKRLKKTDGILGIDQQSEGGIRIEKRRNGNNLVETDFRRINEEIYSNRAVLTPTDFPAENPSQGAKNGK
jgi:hypothetical protein